MIKYKEKSLPFTNMNVFRGFTIYISERKQDNLNCIKDTLEVP